MLPAPAQYPAVETAATRILDAAPASVRAAADATCAPPRASGTRHLAPLTHAAEAHRGIQTKFLIARHAQWPNHPFFRSEPAPDERVFPWPAACHAPDPAALLAVTAPPSVASTPSGLMSPRDPRCPRAGSLASSSIDTLAMPPPLPPPAPQPPRLVPPLLPPARALVSDARMVASPAHVPIMSPAHVPAALIPHARAPSMDRATVVRSASMSSSRASAAAARDPRDRASPETLKRRARSPSPDRTRGLGPARRPCSAARSGAGSQSESEPRSGAGSQSESEPRSRPQAVPPVAEPGPPPQPVPTAAAATAAGTVRPWAAAQSESQSQPVTSSSTAGVRPAVPQSESNRPVSPPSAKSTPARSAASSATPSMSRSRMASPVPQDMSPPPPPPPPPPASRASDKTSKPDMPPPSVARRADADATRSESRSRTASASSSAGPPPPARAGSESAPAGHRVAPPSRENSDPGPVRARLPAGPRRESSVPTDPRLAARAGAADAAAGSTAVQEPRHRSASMARDASSPELARRPTMSMRAKTAADKAPLRTASVDAQRDLAAPAVVPADPRRRSSTSEHPPPSPPPPPRDPRHPVSESRSNRDRADSEMRESRASSSTTLTSSPAPMPMPPPPPVARQGSIRLPPMPMVVVEVEVPGPTFRRKKAAAASTSAAPDKKKAKLATAGAASTAQPPPPPPPGPAPSLKIPMAPVPGSARARHAAALVDQDSGQRGLGSATNGDSMQVDHPHHDHEQFSGEEAVKDEVDEGEPMELDEDLPSRFEPRAPPPRASVSRRTSGSGSAKRRPTAAASTAAANGTDHNGDDDDDDDHTLTIPVTLAAVMPRACRALFALPGAEEVGAHTRTVCFVDEAIDVVRKDFLCSRHPPSSKTSTTGKPKVRIIRSVEPAGSHRERCFKCNECGVRLLPPRLFEEVVRQRFVEQFDLVSRVPALFGHLQGTRIMYADGIIGDRIPGSPVQWMRDAAAAVAEGQPADEAVRAFEPAALPATVQADLTAFAAAGKKGRHRGFSDLNAGDIGGELLRSIVPSTPWDQRMAAGGAAAGSSASAPASAAHDSPRARSSHASTPSAGGHSRRGSAAKAAAARPSADVVAVVDVDTAETPPPPAAATPPLPAAPAAPPVRSLSRAVAQRLGQSAPDLAWTPPAVPATAAATQPAVPVPSPPPPAAAAAPSPPTTRLRPGLRARPVQRAKRSGTPAVSSDEDDNDDDDDDDDYRGTPPTRSAHRTPPSVVAAAAPGAQGGGGIDTDSEDEMIGAMFKRVSQARVAAAADAPARR
ncbi:hypothetical protein GGF32_003340 [Allomyces javanicus]|nr:hypothetical protein GGF32_003340 [Allomyces javanicus]